MPIRSSNSGEADAYRVEASPVLSFSVLRGAVRGHDIPSPDEVAVLTRLRGGRSEER